LIHLSFKSKFSSKVQDAYGDAGTVATEVISGIRTVASFSGEEREVQRYSNALGKAKKMGIYKGFFQGFGMGSTYFMMFGTYALALW
jgi:ATP-binding cassette subfamily B (MDR/TAP) protein 1